MSNSNGIGYENLLETGCHENNACFGANDTEFRAEFEWKKSTGKNARRLASLDSGSNSKAGIAFTVLAALFVIAALAMSSYCAVRLHMTPPKMRGFVSFVLDSNSMPSCHDHEGTNRHQELPCLAAPVTTASEPGGTHPLDGEPIVYQTSKLYNSALGPWKLDECSVELGKLNNCGIEFTRQGTHFSVERSGLYELSAQVTFAKDSGKGAELVWQVDNVEWVAAHKSGRANGGPTCTHLAAVRRLRAGQKVSLHAVGAPHSVGAEPSSTRIMLSML